MVRSEAPEPPALIGHLVPWRAKDVSHLVGYEIDLAKTELRGDMRRVGLTAP
jgi:hypothetical protein